MYVRTGVGVDLSLGLCYLCLADCAYSDDSEFVLGNAFGLSSISTLIPYGCGCGFE